MPPASIRVHDETEIIAEIDTQAVYHIPTTEESEPSKSIALALQTLFYQVHSTHQSSNIVMMAGLYNP